MPKPRSSRPKPRARRARPQRLGPLEVREVTALRQELERLAPKRSARWNADPEEVQRSVAKLVLTLVDFLRQLLERQAIRRVENKTLTKKQTEDVGRALMQLEDTIRALAVQFGIDPSELNLELGPLGRLM